MDEAGRTANDRVNGGEEEPRKPYIKPEISEVPLRPDEAVLGGCKTSSVSGPAQHRCSSPAPCSSLIS
jgi:hypothetical protein